MKINRLKSFFNFIKKYLIKRNSKDQIKLDMSEEALYSLDGYQLKNLLDKNISFNFFQLEAFNKELNSNLKEVLKKMKLKNQQEILSELEGQDFKKPIVLICKTGDISIFFAKELRAKGFVNVYFMKKGFQSLTEAF